METEWEAEAEKWRKETEEKDRRWRAEKDERDVVRTNTSKFDYFDFLTTCTQAYRKSQADLASARGLLSQRTAELDSVRKTLDALEAESRKLGESHTTDRFSLELELDRLRRDLARCEDDLKRARTELADKEAKVRDRESAIDRLVRGLEQYRINNVLTFVSSTLARRES